MSEVKRSRPLARRPGWVLSVGAGLVAALAATGLMFLARSVFQVRTLPERVMEWVLLFVPIDKFEEGIIRFGPEAKEIALAAGIMGMVLALAVPAVIVVRYLANPWAPLGLGLLFYLVVMAVVLPITGAGFFATGLVQSPLLVNACYLAVSLLYGSVLMAFKLREAAGAAGPAGVGAPQTRRAFVVGLAGTAGTVAISAVFGRDPTAVRSSLPRAEVPQSLLTSATSAVSSAASSVASIAGASGSSASTSTASSPAASSAGSAAADPYPKPPPPQPVKRDKEGAMISTPHPKGEIVAPITPNQQFYIVTKNASGDPLIDPATWRVILEGEFNKPVQLDYLTMRKLPQTKYFKTQECVSNFTTKCELAPFGCDLVSTVQFTGVKLDTLFEVAGGLKPAATHLVASCVDEYTSTLPIKDLLAMEAMLAYEMNGQPLPYEHGYPAKLVTPGRYGYKNAKWVVGLRALNKEVVDWFGQRNWSKEAFVKTMSRIDVPARGDQLKAGAPQKIGGIAYAGLKGISKVEFSWDGGKTWTAAKFIEAPEGKDMWKRWEGSFTPAAPGKLEVVSRATDGEGKLQIEPFGLTQPDGGTGWDRFELAVV